MKRGNRFIWCLLAAFLLAFLPVGDLLAAEPEYWSWEEGAGDLVYSNEETGYGAYIRDEEDLLSEEEEKSLAETMKAATAYGNVLFLSADGDNMNPEDYLETYYAEWLSRDGTVFLVEMSVRELRLENSGSIRHTITPSYSNTITDNVYRMASEGDYYGCANEAFAQCITLLEGGHIARPMKYICNALLALILALLINYAAVRISNRNHRITEKELDKQITDSLVLGAANKKRIAHRKRESGSSSGGSFSGGGGGGGFSGGGGGGGGHSGGGHSF